MKMDMLFSDFKLKLTARGKVDGGQDVVLYGCGPQIDMR